MNDNYLINMLKKLNENNTITLVESQGVFFFHQEGRREGEEEEDDRLQIMCQ